MTIKCPKYHNENPDTQKYFGKCDRLLQVSKDIEVTETTEAPKEKPTREATLANRDEIIEELGKNESIL